MGRKLALLVATYRYQDTGLARLTSPGADAAALAVVLRDPEIAGFDVTLLVNEPHHLVGEAIGDFYRSSKRDDLTLLYFTGHGVKDDSSRLFFALTNTRQDNLAYTGLAADELDRTVEDSRSQQKVLILDCCYSGAYPAGRIAKADSAVHSLEALSGRGRTVLTASDSTQYAFEDSQGRGSVFTRALVDGIGDGSADLDGDGDITLDELYTYVYDRVVAEQPRQRPKKQTNVEGRIVIARNIEWALPAGLVDAIKSPAVGDRLAAAEELGDRYRTGNLMVRERVRTEIIRMIDDPDPDIAGWARSWLATHRASSPSGQHTTGPGPSEPRWQPQPTTNRSRALRLPPKPWPVVIMIAVLLVAVGAAVILAATRPDGGGRASAPTEGQPPGSASAAKFEVQRIPVDGRVADLAIDSARHTLYTGNLAGDTEIIDTDTRTVTGTVPVGEGFTAVVLDQSSNLLYGSNFNDRVVKVIDIAKRAVVGTVPVPDGPTGLALGTSRLYVVNVNADHVTVIDTSTRAEVARIPTSGHASAITTDLSGGMTLEFLLIAQDDPQTKTGSVLLADAEPKIVSTIPLGQPTTGLVFDRNKDDGAQTIYVATEDNSVSVVDVAARVVSARVPVGKRPTGLTIDPDTGTLYVANYDDNTVTVIDVISRRAIATVPVGKGPTKLLVDPGSHFVYCANSEDNAISVIKRVG